jgi:hypothetical protein
MAILATLPPRREVAGRNGNSTVTFFTFGVIDTAQHKLGFPQNVLEMFS